MRATVSKHGGKLGACFHPSRRPLANASGLLRMTFAFTSTPPDPIRTSAPQGPLARPFFILRDRRETTSAGEPRAAARPHSLRSRDRRISLAQADEPESPRRPHCRDTDPRRLPGDCHQRQELSGASACLAVRNGQMALADDRSPRWKPVEQPLEQPAACDQIAELCKQGRSS